MHVEVIGLAASGGRPEVDPDVDGVAPERRLERHHRRAHERPQLGVLVGGERLEVGDTTVGEHQQVPGGVGELVEEHEAGAAAVQQVLLVVGPVRSEDALEERASVGGRVGA